MNATRIIKGLRAKRLLSQENVAKLLNLSRQRYNTIENNLLKTDLKLILRLLDVLEVSDKDLTEFFDALEQDYKSYKNELRKE